MRNNSGANRRAVNPENVACTDTDQPLLSLSAAVAMLMRGMFGGFRQAKPVHK
jgi:hypothetical protein